MKEEQINIAEVRQHPNYIRHRKNAEYISGLAQVLNDSGWIFPAIELQPIPEDQVKISEGAKFWILDGTNRIAACIEAGYNKKVPAIIHPNMTPGEAIAIQLKTNIAHGLRLTSSEQTAAIKKMHDLGMMGKAIAKEAGISPSSVSRIVSEKQRATPDGDRGNAAPKKNKIRKPFNADAWMKLLGKVLKGWKENGSKIRKAGFPGSCGNSLDEITETLSDENKK